MSDDPNPTQPGGRHGDRRFALWEAINRYTVACGGDPSVHVYGNTERQKAVAEIERAARSGGVLGTTAIIAKAREFMKIMWPAYSKTEKVGAIAELIRQVQEGQRAELKAAEEKLRAAEAIVSTVLNERPCLLCESWQEEDGQTDRHDPDCPLVTNSFVTVDGNRRWGRPVISPRSTSIEGPALSSEQSTPIDMNRGDRDPRV